MTFLDRFHVLGTNHFHEKAIYYESMYYRMVTCHVPPTNIETS